MPTNKRKIIPCNDGHDDFLYYINYDGGNSNEIIKVCRRCYTNESSFNDKKFIIEIRTLEGSLVWRAGLRETDSRNPANSSGLESTK